MKSISQLFDEAWKKKEKRGWKVVYIMVDLHGVVLKSNYHKENDLEFINEYTQEALRWLSAREDVRLILWSSSHEKEIQSVIQWFGKHDIRIDYVNENPDEPNTEYASFDKKPYFSILLDDKAGFDPDKDWFDLWEWQNVMDEKA